MQLRKLIRLLQEAEKEHGGYIECCIDTELGASKNKFFKYYSIPDVEPHWCVWNPESEKENQRQVLVLGNF